MADETTRLMLNALLLLNGGGIAAIPALKTMAPDGALKLEGLAWSGIIFFLITPTSPLASVEPLR